MRLERAFSASCRRTAYRFWRLIESDKTMEEETRERGMLVVVTFEDAKGCCTDLPIAVSSEKCRIVAPCVVVYVFSPCLAWVVVLVFSFC